jgi:leucyl-tRNA synthetase
MLAPLAPHIAEELWLAFGNEESGSQTPWPGVSFQVTA